MLASVLFSADSSRPAGVPADAVYFNGKWYRVYVDGSGWKAAQAKCQRLGGNLAIVPNKETHDFLKKLANGRKLLIGATNERTDVWKWVDGTDVRFQPWDRGQPNNVKRREHFVAMGPNGNWLDVAENSDWSQGYICEWIAR